MVQRAKRERGEAERIYEAIFRTAIPPLIEKRFYQACEALFPGISLKEGSKYEEALEKVSDLEALELAARLLHIMPLLVTRFRVMVHLAETLPQNQRFFIHSRGGRGRCYFSLSVGGMRTVVKFVKGWILLARIQNV